MKTTLAAIALTFLAASAASAQSIRIGPDGVRVGPERRVIERRVIERRDRDWDRPRDRCRTTIVRRENRRGEMVTRRIREC
jgi:hypothetical protein